MCKQIPTLSRIHIKPLTTPVSTIIALHNEGVQICLGALATGQFSAMWSAYNSRYETELLPEHFEYLCKHGNFKDANVYFDFELHDSLADDELDAIMNKYKNIQHV